MPQSSSMLGIAKLMAAARQKRPKLSPWVKEAQRREQEERESYLGALARLTKHIDCVTRLVSQKEALADPEAVKSMEKEMEQLET